MLPFRRIIVNTLTGVLAIAPFTSIAQPYSGTIFIDPDIITDADPGTLVSVTYTGQGSVTVYDNRVPDWVTIDAYLFDVLWNDGLTSVAMVNPEFGSEAAAAAEVQTYAAALGRVPTCLRADVNELWIHAGIASFGGGNNSILIHTGRGQEYIDDGILEEAFLHEATHTSLDAAHAGSPDWLTAQASDASFISTYAQDHPLTEDLAESFLPWLAVRYRESRISTTDYNNIVNTIPARLAYLDSLPCDLYPITSAASVVTIEDDPIRWHLFPSPALDRIDIQTDRPLPANARFEVLSLDGRSLLDRPISGSMRLDLTVLPAGLYVWRCIAEGVLLGSGRLAVE